MVQTTSKPIYKYTVLGFKFKVENMLKYEILIKFFIIYPSKNTSYG